MLQRAGHSDHLVDHSQRQADAERIVPVEPRLLAQWHAQLQHHAERPLERRRRDELVDDGRPAARRPDARTTAERIQGRHSSYFWDNFLDETSVSFQDNITVGRSVRRASVGDRSRELDVRRRNGRRSTSLQFGGNTGLPRNSSTVTSELQNQLSWISLDNKHRYKFGLDFQYHRYSQDNTTNRLRNVHSTTRCPISRMEFRRSSRGACR